MFKFNFNVESDETETDNNAPNTTFKFNFNEEAEKKGDDISTENKDVIQWTPAEEVSTSINENSNRHAFENAQLYFCGDINIYYTNEEIEEIDNSQDNDIVAQLESEHSDLLVGKYEGGFKIWECTRDLIEFMARNFKTDCKLNNTRVLDLGCGAGILGIYSILKGATVHFQDYNYEVLKLMTIPNVQLNLQEDTRKDQRFFFGDWGSYTQLMENEIADNENDKFDYILTSETIYNIGNYEKLYVLIRKLLKKSGIVSRYLSAKSHYFGVGGGIRQFEEYITKENKLQSENVWESDLGIKRGILKITHCGP